LVAQIDIVFLGFNLMTEAQLAILKQKLADEFVPHLPPLLDQTKPADHVITKNASRAFSAFAIQKIAVLDTVSAAKAVVDDYEDNGIDAIHYHQASKKLFLVQAKLKADEPFAQDEANAFVKGVRDLLNQYYDRFNKNVQDRQAELDIALDESAEIVLVIAHTANLVSQHAKDVLNEFLADADKPDERLNGIWVDYGPAQVEDDLLAEHAVPLVDDEIVIFGHKKIDGPRVTYYGQVSVSALAKLYAKHGNNLLERNIRYFLGIASSAVNRAIHGTLEGQADSFFYLSNGVTAIANSIEFKGAKDGGRRFAVNGLSVINGAQTIASSHHFITTKPEVDVSAARVLLTLIQVDQNDAFSASVTRARNHQNPVSPAHFAALDDIQERLRRELAFYKIVYRYRPEARTAATGIDVMTIDEASLTLALFHPDPGFPVTIKREPSKLLDSKSSEYAKLFIHDLSGRRLANAVRIYRCASRLLAESEIVAVGLEKLIYRHGRYAIMWLTLRANAVWASNESVMTDAEAAALMSHPLDVWRERVRAEAVAELAAVDKGPLAFFRNLTNTRPFVVKLRDAGI
jgi:AIPR protein